MSTPHLLTVAINDPELPNSRTRAEERAQHVPAKLDRNFSVSPHGSLQPAALDFPAQDCTSAALP